MFTRTRLQTFAIALSGVGVFHLLGLPLPFLFGPMFACLLAALLGVQMQGAGQVSVGARTILGVAVGASVTPALLGQVPLMAVTLALIPAYVAVIGLVGVPFFHRVCGFDRITSYYAAMPGGFQDMVIFGQEAGGNARALSLIHATRVLIIVTLVPFLLTGPFGVSLDHPIGAPASELPLHEMAIMVAIALIGWKGGERIGLFGASILGPLLLAMVLSLGDVIHHRPPAEAILVAQFFIGMGIGMYYRGVTVAELRHDVASGAAFAVVLAGLAAGFTLLAHHIGDAPQVEAFLSFSPGGQAEMTVLAIVAGADLGFVVIHHLMRMILVITGAPIIARLWSQRRE
ncbi:AbrB family transcriptional regulator [Roseinatronobacter alkalisoli]|uniref:AbrB family transcriptional regulator n=1 Tax=Roseinatronobacter alkalisoli TaxID=3028235 RepID=A0ABT5T5J3_9RHOB|nr:AbrB family transcriptional regulator [Roseinatronobacter sp. HJB301]MDD7969661.1 AbrB family transcriptional regulator [Roseinatronobacter sp. HJB301]